MKKITTLGLALGLAVVLAGSAYAEVKFGVAGPITGPNAAFGAQLTNGAQQAVDELVAEGGATSGAGDFKRISRNHADAVTGLIVQ